MQKKFDQAYEDKIILLAENKLESGHYKVFDDDARVVKRHRLPELPATGKTHDSTCLVITNREGETIVLTQEFEHILYNILKNRA